VEHPGRYGWVGGTGTSAHITPSTGTVAILFTQVRGQPRPAGWMRTSGATRPRSADSHPGGREPAQVELDEDPKWSLGQMPSTGWLNASAALSTWAGRPDGRSRSGRSDQDVVDPAAEAGLADDQVQHRAGRGLSGVQV